MKKNNSLVRKCGVLLAVFFLSVFSSAHHASALGLPGIAGLEGFQIGGYGGWESKYAAEGRNDLPNGGIYVMGASVGYAGLEVAFDYIGGDKEQSKEEAEDTGGYGEVNISAGYGFEFLGIEYSFGYTRLEFTHEGDRRDKADNEWSGGASYEFSAEPSPFSLLLSGDYVYSTDAEGGFLEIGASIGTPKLFGFFNLSPYASQSFDFGYRTPENNSPNNFQFGIEAEIEVVDKVSLVGHISHSIKQKDVNEEIKADEGVKAAGTWGGVSLAFAL